MSEKTTENSMLALLLSLACSRPPPEAPKPAPKAIPSIHGVEWGARCDTLTGWTPREVDGHTVHMTTSASAQMFGRPVANPEITCLHGIMGAASYTTTEAEETAARLTATLGRSDTEEPDRWDGGGLEARMVDISEGIGYLVIISDPEVPRL